MPWRITGALLAFVLLAGLACGSSGGADNGGNSKAGAAGSATSPTSGGSAESAMSGGSAGSAALDGTPPTVDEFCQLWVNEFSTYMEHCSCDSGSVMRYREWAATACEPTGFLGSLPAAVAAGDFTFDGHAALALFERLRQAVPKCLEEPFRALKLDSVETYSLAGVFLGTRALGEPCTHPVEYKGGFSDCREGVCAWDGAEAGVCIAFVGLGEECDASGDQNFRSTVARLCHDRRQPDDDGEYESAFDSLICAASGGSRRCLNDRPDGAACHSSEACRSGLCLNDTKSTEGVCTAKLANGEPCQAHLECASGACQNVEPRVCGPLLADGQACEYSHAACASGVCGKIATDVVCVSPGTLARGEACTQSAECMSNGGGQSRESACQAGHCVADICAGYAER